jgi:hypothetical protein
MKIEIEETGNGWIVTVKTADVRQFQRVCEGHATTVHHSASDVMRRINHIFEMM